MSVEAQRAVSGVVGADAANVRAELRQVDARAGNGIDQLGFAVTQGYQVTPARILRQHVVDRLARAGAEHQPSGLGPGLTNRDPCPARRATEQLEGPRAAD